MVVAIVMLLSVFAFGAGNCVMYDPRVAELERRLEELEEDNRLQAERVQELERENGVLRLEVHRNTAQLKLIEYSDTFDESDYYADDWEQLQGHIEYGLDVIRQSANKNEIDKALLAAKQALRAIEMRSVIPQFDRHPLSDLSISTDLEKQIRQDYIKFLAEYLGVSYRTMDWDWFLKRVFVYVHYGTFDGSIALTMACPVISRHFDPPLRRTWHPNIGGVQFSSISYVLRIIVWNNGSFYWISQHRWLRCGEYLLENGMLTLADLEKIAERHFWLIIEGRTDPWSPWWWHYPYNLYPYNF